MYWLYAALFGAFGGSIVSAVAFCTDVLAWQEERRRYARIGVDPKPKLTTFMDLKADSLVLLTRFVLGAVAGSVFHAEVIGPTAAIAVGASAHALLAQFGKNSPYEPRHTRNSALVPPQPRTVPEILTYAPEKA